MCGRLNGLLNRPPSVLPVAGGGSCPARSEYRDGAGQTTSGPAPRADFRIQHGAARVRSRAAANGARKPRRKPKVRAARPPLIGRFVYWGARARAVGRHRRRSASWSGSARICRRSSRSTFPSAPPSIKIVDMHGRLLATRGDMGGARVSLKELPPYVPKAFRRHRGPALLLSFRHRSVRRRRAR